MADLMTENDIIDCLYDDEEVICTRDYNICILDTVHKFEKYAKECEKILRNSQTIYGCFHQVGVLASLPQTIA